MSFMKGDTFLEVASCLARTDITDPHSFAVALDGVKRYVRSKIKKGKGNEVAARGGKLEQLEGKYAHLGYQDLFYLARLQLSLPPSLLSLPRPSSPVRKTLVKAGYPLPAHHLLEDPWTRLERDDPEYIGRGRRGTIKEIASTSRSRSAKWRRDIGLESVVDTGETAGPSGSQVTPAPTPPSATLDDIAHRSGIASSQEATRASIVRSLSNRSVPVGSPSATSPVGLGITNPSGPATQENEVRRLLEARIKALQSALDSLEVDSLTPLPSTSPRVSPVVSPRLAVMSSPLASIHSQSPSSREYPSAPSPPPQIPLPPTPPRNTTSRPLPRPLHIRNPSSTPQISPVNSFHRHRPQSPNLVNPVTPTYMGIDADPFAAPALPAVMKNEDGEGLSHREVVRMRRQGIIQDDGGRWTPPPRYEVEGGMPGMAM